MPSEPDQDYALRFSDEEVSRLQRQASRLAPATERVFRSAGIGPGMRVLDIGCGAGDVAILAGNLVGPTGHVVAVDRDPRMLAIVRQRAGESAAPIETLRAEVLAIPRAREFDALVGRFVMMYQPDTLAAVRRLVTHVKPGGRLAFLEFDQSTPPSSVPRLPVWERASELIFQAFARSGTPRTLVFDLHNALRRVGCEDVSAAVVDALLHHPGNDYVHQLVVLLRSLLPVIEEHGLATAAQLDLDTLAARMDTEAVTIGGLGRGPIAFGVWGRAGN